MRDGEMEGWREGRCELDFLWKGRVLGEKQSIRKQKERSRDQMNRDQREKQNKKTLILSLFFCFSAFSVFLILIF